ncbi:MAG TPA: CpsD/CapB family tyrosine-protein kinase [Verrucomicrobiae bacterium]|nr:CpsD/CapB family tyrosine-protein kinase [Verrucomicrobiae bacterium]
MSRIHEALKKAATERAAQIGTAPSVEHVETIDDSLIDSVDIPMPGNVRLRSVELEEPTATGWERFIQTCKKTEWKIDPRFSVFTEEKSFPHGAEKFRTLRSRLYQIAAVRPLKRILLTSSVPEEGKTFVASNLAQSIARHESKKVLLIDGDLRASRLHLTMGAPGTPGLADYLAGEADESQIVQVGSKGNLCFLPGGSNVSNPAELLLSERMKTLLDRMSSLFDWIVIDSTPAIAVHDASVLADLCDGVLFVVRAGSTDFEVAQRAAGEFRAENLLGVVLNRVDDSETYGNYYYGYNSEFDSK